MPIEIAAPTKTKTPTSPRVTARQADSAKKEAQAQLDRRQAQLEGVTDSLQTAALILVMLGQKADAGAVFLWSRPLAEGAVAVAQSSETVASGVEYLSKTAPIAALATPILGFAAQIFVNHGWFGIKAEHFAGANVVDKQTLEYQTETMLMRKKMEAEQEMLRVKQEYQDFLNSQPSMDVKGN